MAADDPLTTALDQERAILAAAADAASQKAWQPAAEIYGTLKVSSLLAALGKVLKAHEPIQIYESADGCGHPRPESGDELDGWLEDHPHGHGPDGASGDVQLCLLSPRNMACPACSELVYSVWGDDDGFIDASGCIVRPLVAAELAGKDSSDGTSQ